MKKFLLLLFVFISFGIVNVAKSQCSVGETIIVVKGVDESNPANVKVTVDIIFDLQTNAGNKYVFIHAYKAVNYPGYFELVKPGKCQTPATPNPSQPTAPPPTRGNQGNLNAALLNIGFNNDIGTAGYLSYITSAQYSPDPGAPMTVGVGLVEVSASPTAGFTRYTFRGVQVATGQAINTPLTVKADLWSSQASSISVAHCWRCGFIYLFNEPVITGTINCTVVTPRTVKFQLNTSSAVALSGNYRFYIDNAPFGTFDALDIQAAPDATGTFSGLINGTTLFFDNIPFAGNNVASESTKSIWIEAIVTSPVGTQTNSTVKLITNTCSALPVKLKNFNASKKVGKVAVSWETEEELNNDGFEIQRRIGNGKYETIAFVDSKAPNGNGSNYSYSYDDAENLPNGVTYYRLRQIDFDGKSIYSDIKAVRSNSKALVVSVYPNPSRGTTNVAIPEGVGTVDASLEDFTGKLIQRWNSLNTRNLQLTNLKPGIYMLRITVRETGDQVVERILVQ